MQGKIHPFRRIGHGSTVFADGVSDVFRPITRHLAVDRSKYVPTYFGISSGGGNQNAAAPDRPTCFRTADDERRPARPNRAERPRWGRESASG